MFIIANLINAVAVVTDLALDLYMYVIIARAVLSWVNPDPFNPIVRFIHNITEPVLKTIRSKMPAIEGIDISPIIAFFIIILIQKFVCQSLIMLAHKLM